MHSDAEKNHSFNVGDAEKYGVEQAIILFHIRFWCDQNKTKAKSQHDGRSWMYQSIREMQESFSYWSEDKIRRLVASLENQGAIISGNYNRMPQDRTKWYAVNQTLDSANLHNGSDVSAEPLPDTKEDEKKDIYNETLFHQSFDVYEKGNRSKAFKLWQKLTSEQREEIAAAIPNYIRVCEHQYRFKFENWINPSDEHWKDKVSAPMRLSI